MVSTRCLAVIKASGKVEERRWRQGGVRREEIEVIVSIEVAGIDRYDCVHRSGVVLRLASTTISILVHTTGIERLSVWCDVWGIEVILVIVERKKLLARAYQSLLLRFPQNMLLCRLKSWVSITCHKFLRWRLSSSGIQTHSTAMSAMSLDIGQVGDLHWFECAWCRILSSVLSLSVVKVVCWIGQHYECLKSSEKSSLKVMQLSTPVGSETGNC